MFHLRLEEENKERTRSSEEMKEALAKEKERMEAKLREAVLPTPSGQNFGE